MNRIKTPDIVSQAFLKAGWSHAKGMPSFMRKDFETAVGPKTAWALSATAKSDKEYLVIQGEYISEGRNALEGKINWIPMDASEDEMKRMVAAAAKEFDACVEATYAVQVFRAKNQSGGSTPRDSFAQQQEDYGQDEGPNDRESHPRC